MIVYIKDRKTFKTKAYGAAQYDATLKSIYDENTTVIMPGTADNLVAGDFVYVDGFIGIVEEIEKENQQLTLTCHDIVTLFRRDLFPVSDNAVNGVEAFIKRQIEANYINISDNVYKLPYLKVTALTTTQSDITPDIEDGVWNIKSFMAKVRRMQDVFTEFSISGDVLNVKIGKRVRPIHNIDFSMSDFEVLEETENKNQVARITARAEDTGAETNWYLLSNGSITQNQSAANRAEGSWEKISVGDATKVAEDVENRFRENSYSHLMEFATKREYGFFDYVKIRTKKGKVLNSYISAIRKKSNNDRIVYKSGELRLLVDEKLKNPDIKMPVIVNSLLSSSTTAPLAAAAGKKLQEQISTLSSDMNYIDYASTIPVPVANEVVTSIPCNVERKVIGLNAPTPNPDFTEFKINENRFYLFIGTCTFQANATSLRRGVQVYVNNVLAGGYQLLPNIISNGGTTVIQAIGMMPCKKNDIVRLRVFLSTPTGTPTLLVPPDATRLEYSGLKILGLWKVD